MIVVADTGPLHYLILLDHAELLHRFYAARRSSSGVAASMRRAGGRKDSYGSPDS